MTASEVYAKMAVLRVVPVIAIEDAEAALRLADALLEGGLPVAEITFRTVAAAAVIEKLARQRSELLVGAGTVLSVENLRRASECGAVFGVAPGLNPEVVREAIRMDFPFSPGVMTPSDIEAGLAFGLKVLKFFPAGAAGGVKMLQSLAAPYAHIGVKFIPTGGVSAANLKEYLEQKAVLAVGGTWIATKDNIAAGQWETVRNHCRNAAAVAAKLRVLS